MLPSDDASSAFADCGPLKLTPLPVNCDQETRHGLAATTTFLLCRIELSSTGFDVHPPSTSQTPSKTLAAGHSA